MKLITSSYAVLIATLAAPLSALAQFGYPTGVPLGVNQFTAPGAFGSVNYQTRSTAGTSFEGLIALAQRLIGYFQVIIFLLAIIMALWGAFQIIKNGDFDKGKNFLLYSFVGVVIAILAFAIIPLACFLTGANNSPACYL